MHNLEDWFCSEVLPHATVDIFSNSEYESNYAFPSDIFYTFVYAFHCETNVCYTLSVTFISHGSMSQGKNRGVLPPSHGRTWIEASTPLQMTEPKDTMAITLIPAKGHY